MRGRSKRFERFMWAGVLYVLGLRDARSKMAFQIFILFVPAVDGYGLDAVGGVDATLLRGKGVGST